MAHERHVPLSSIQDVDQTLLLQEEELGLIKMLAQYPLIIEASALALEPHRVTFYLQELAAQFHSYYNKNRVLPLMEKAVKSEDGSQGLQMETNENALGAEHISVHASLTPALTAARLALLQQVQTVLRNGLTVLGLSAPEKM
jgi:arginyl-tRNA synthetase